MSGSSGELNHSKTTLIIIDEHHDLSIPSNFRLLDISKEKDYLAVLQDDWLLVVYKLAYTDEGIYYTERTPYEVGPIESSEELCMYLSVASDTGAAVLSFVQLTFDGMYTNRMPDKALRYCRIFWEGKEIEKEKIKCQGRAVFVNDKLVLIGAHTMDVHNIKNFKLEYFLDLDELQKGYEGLISGEHTAWAKHTLRKGSKSSDGEKLVPMTRHIQSSVLVTTYKGSLTRVWSILDGSLLVSFFHEKTAHFMAISWDQRFVASYDKHSKHVNVYCAKSGLLLYTYYARGIQSNPKNSSVTSVRFCSYRSYIIISGISGNSDGSHDAFYEIWSISQERLIRSEKQINVVKEGFHPFILEYKTKNEVNFQNFRSNSPRQGQENNDKNPGNNNSEPQPVDPAHDKYSPLLYGVLTKKESDKLVFKRKLVFNCTERTISQVAETESKTKWGNFSFEKVKNSGVYRLKPLYDICDPLDSNRTLSYLLNYDQRIYVLRFGGYMTQLWILTEIPPDKVDEARVANKVFNFGSVDKPENKEYYNSMKESVLLFARAYKGNHHGIYSTFRDTWRSYGSSIRFMTENGHIIIDIEQVEKKKSDNTDNTSNNEGNQKLKRNPTFLKRVGIKIYNSFVQHKPKKNEPETMEEELFLPLSKIESLDAEFEFCEIESAFQALHFLDTLKYPSDHDNITEEVFDVKRKEIYDQVYKIIEKALKSQKITCYFSTISGSKTMAMLASFKKGRKLLYHIIWSKNISINVFSYTTDKELKENVLTVLMEENEYDLFNLMFNQILIDYYKKGTGNLSAIMDALLFLQKENFTPQLLSSTKKLSFLRVKDGVAPILNSERKGMLSIKGLQQEDTSRVEYLDTFSVLEQLELYNYGKWNLIWIHFLFYQYACFHRQKRVKIIVTWIKKAYHTIVGNSMMQSRLAKLCIVPLPYFNSYRAIQEEKRHNSKNKKDTKIDTFNEVEYLRYSPFALLASSISDNSIFKQGDTVMEMLINYKWETFARSRFYLILFCHSVYYVAYSTGVSFPEELFGYEPGTPLNHPSHFASIAFMFLSGVILLIQEFRQFLLNKLDYFRSFYNYVDLASFILPVVTFILLRTRDSGSQVLYAVSSVTTLVLWSHMILRLRVFRPFGNLLEIIIQLVGKIFPILIIMILIVMGFTNAFVVLLRRQDDDFFRDQFGVSSNNDFSDQSQQNIFKDIFLSYTSVWLFIFGYFDPVFSGDVGNYVMSIILVVLFSFVVVLILFNVIIALMSGTIDEIRKRGNKIWIAHFAAVVSEIELLWGTNSTKFSKKNNPTHVYYNANIETVRSHHAKIVKENDELKKKLKDDFSI